MTSLFTMQAQPSSLFAIGCISDNSLCIVDFDLASENLFIDDTDDLSSSEPSTSKKQENKEARRSDYTLTEYQQVLENGISLTMRHLQNPALRVYLPLGELLCDKTRKYMTMLWLRDMESELWSIMYQGHSDTFGAFDELLSFQWRICSVTDLATDNATFAASAIAIA